MIKTFGAPGQLPLLTPPPPPLSGPGDTVFKVVKSAQPLYIPQKVNMLTFLINDTAKFNC